MKNGRWHDPEGEVKSSRSGGTTEGTPDHKGRTCDRGRQVTVALEKPAYVQQKQ